MAGSYAQQWLYAGRDPGSLLLRKRGTGADLRPAAEEYDGVFEDLTARQVFAHKMSVPRESNMEKAADLVLRPAAFLKKRKHFDGTDFNYIGAAQLCSSPRGSSLQLPRQLWQRRVQPVRANDTGVWGRRGRKRNYSAGKKSFRLILGGGYAIIGYKYSGVCALRLSDREGRTQHRLNDNFLWNLHSKL